MCECADFICSKRSCLKFKFFADWSTYKSTFYLRLIYFDTGVSVPEALLLMLLPEAACSDSTVTVV